MKKTLTILLILFLFVLGPLGFINVLDTSVSLKYEVEQSKAMFPDDNVSDLEKYYNKRYYFFWTITILAPALGIGLTYYKFILPKKNKT